MIRTLPFLLLMLLSAVYGARAATAQSQTDVPSSTLSAFSDPTHTVSESLGGFTYDFSIPGWPSGWTIQGLSPNILGVVGGRTSYDDLFSGRPRYDLVPTQLHTAPQLSHAPGRSAVEAHFGSRPFLSPEPLTEGTYWSSNRGLKSVRIVHAQQRIWQRLPDAASGGASLLDAPGTPPDSLAQDDVAPDTSTVVAPTETIPPSLSPPVVANMLFSYHGIAATGEYPGSKVARGRQLAIQFAVERGPLRVGVAESFNRRSVGAHGGVNPPVFLRLGASVRDASAVRETRRNDLTLFGSYELAQFRPLEVALTWSTATERYTTTADTIEARSRRIAWDIAQPIVVRRDTKIPLTASVIVRGARDAIASTRGFGGLPASSLIDTTTDATAGAWFAGLGGDVQVGTSLSARVSAGVENAFGRGIATGTGPAGSAEIIVDVAPLSFQASLATTLDRARLVHATGYGEYLSSAVREVDAGRTTTGALTSAVQWRTVRLSLTGFATRSADAIDFFATDVPDSVAVMQVPGTSRTVGASAELNWRADAAKGVYLNARGTLMGRPSTPDGLGGTTAVAWREVIPDWHVAGQVGFRRSMFEGDLIGDFALRARAWPAFGGRDLHPQTGLLVVPAASSNSRVPASGTLDFVVEAKVRVATLWVAFENFLSGTQALEGNLLVPGYPLEEQRLRFGVNWPIRG